MIEKLFKKKRMEFRDRPRYLPTLDIHPCCSMRTNSIAVRVFFVVVVVVFIIIIMCRVVSLCRCSICPIYQFRLTQPVRDIISHLNPPPSTHPPLSLSLSQVPTCVQLWLHYTHMPIFHSLKNNDRTRLTVMWVAIWNGSEWALRAMAISCPIELHNTQHTTDTRISTIYPGLRGFAHGMHTSVLFFTVLQICVCALPQLPINPRSAERPKHPDFDQIPKCNEAIIDTNDARKISRGAGWNFKKLKKKKRPPRCRQSTSEFHLAHIIYWLENIYFFFAFCCLLYERSFVR